MKPYVSNYHIYIHTWCLHNRTNYRN